LAVFEGTEEGTEGMKLFWILILDFGLGKTNTQAILDIRFFGIAQDSFDFGSSEMTEAETGLRD
jgi:hypothetical protein